VSRELHVTAEHDAAERREAARLLLTTPFVTDPEDLALIRRHAPALRQTFAVQLGYPLVVEPGFARLLKTPLPEWAPVRSPGTGREFSAHTYTLLSLLCAALLTPEAGEQILISTLIEQVRADAAGVGITLEDTLPERRSLVTALDLLLSWGVLAETDGTVSRWGEVRDEALLTVNRPLLAQLLPKPVREARVPADLWQVDPNTPEQPRRELRRALVENPVVHRDDLTPAEADVLRRERRDLELHLAENFGYVVDVRAEGALAYDPDERPSTASFPGPGTVRQAALLLLDALIDTARPAPGDQVVDATWTRAGFFVPLREVRAEVDDLARKNVRYWAEEYTSDPLKLAHEVVDLLQGFGLLVDAGTDEPGIVVRPASARYRPDPQRTPAKPRSKPVPEPETTGSLFDALPEDM
jgi:uncharacterized protein (TIGR02678 family)